MLSRPNIVMNHGNPAAGRLLPPATGGEKRRAARSTRLRRYVAVSGAMSHSSLGASVDPPFEAPLHVRPGPFRAARVLRPAERAAADLPRDVTTSRSVVQLPCGSTRTAKVSPPSSMLAGAEAEMTVSRLNVSRAYWRDNRPSSIREA